jgi:hypothetical protein
MAASYDGVSWQKMGDQPVLGLGAGGEPGHAARSNLMKVGDGYRLY